MAITGLPQVRGNTDTTDVAQMGRGPVARETPKPVSADEPEVRVTISEEALERSRQTREVEQQAVTDRTTEVINRQREQRTEETTRRNEQRDSQQRLNITV